MVERLFSQLSERTSSPFCSLQAAVAEAAAAAVVAVEWTLFAPFRAYAFSPFCSLQGAAAVAVERTLLVRDPAAGGEKVVHLS